MDNQKRLNIKLKSQNHVYQEPVAEENKEEIKDEEEEDDQNKGIGGEEFKKELESAVEENKQYY